MGNFYRLCHDDHIDIVLRFFKYINIKLTREDFGYKWTFVDDGRFFADKIQGDYWIEICDYKRYDTNPYFAKDYPHYFRDRYYIGHEKDEFICMRRLVDFTKTQEWEPEKPKYVFDDFSKEFNKAISDFWSEKENKGIEK